MRKLGISINTANIIIKAIELFPAFKGKNYKTLLNWSYRFLKRNNYSIRRATHLGQELKKNVKEEFIKFLNIIYSIRRTYHINESYECIINMDETPVWFEMISKTTVIKLVINLLQLKHLEVKEQDYHYYWLLVQMEEN